MSFTLAQQSYGIMKALTYDRFGNVDVLRISDVPEPSVPAGSVLIAMRASSLNAIDIKARNGEMWPLVNKKFPKIPGSDIAGVVSKVGSGVTDFKVGDEVFGSTDPFKGTAFAEMVSVPSKQLATKPKSLSFEQAVTLPVTGLAALSALRTIGKLHSGQSVLIHGASGAVGLFAVQMAKAIGGVVTAVSSPSAISLVKSFGADRVLDYKKVSSSELGGPFDLIINASGKMPYTVGSSLLKANGKLIEPSPTIPIVIGSMLLNLIRGKKHLPLMPKLTREILTELGSMAADGLLKTTVAATFQLQDSKQAFERMEKGGAIGKMIIVS